MSLDISICAAEPSECDEILKLIHELALYEKAPDEVQTTREDLLRDGFSENPLFRCFLGRIDQKIEGFALFFLTWSTWKGRPTLYLEDLYVRESARGKGLGLALLRRLAAEAVALQCARMEWAVLDWNRPAIDFYESLGAFHKKDWLPFRIEGRSLSELANQGKRS